MMRIKYIFILIVIFVSEISAQQILEGETTHISSQNIYVRFESTSGISIGDTLFLQIENRLLPAIQVKFLSSKSCAGKNLTTEELSLGLKLIAIIHSDNAIHDVSQAESNLHDSIEVQIEDKGEFNNPAPVQSGITGKIGLSAYSSLSNLRSSNDFQRWRYLFSLNGDSIYKSPFSIESYITFSYRADEWNSVSENIGRALRIYNSAVKFNFTNETSIWAGRRINEYVTSVSAIDGIQFQTKWGDFYTGLIAGSRPGLGDFGLNFKLFQYGIYVARNDEINNSSMQNTIAYFEQTNDFKTDRRFLYFQHNNNLIKNMYLFLSAEADIYKREKNIGKTTFDLTSLYIMARYSPSRIINITGSYDARKNVIYYETFKSFADSLLESEIRQGLRFRLNLRPFNLLMIGLTYGYRFKNSDERPTNNFGGYLTYSKIPFINSSMSVSYNNLITSYVEGNIAGIRAYKDIIEGLLSGGFGYKKIIYKFSSTVPDLRLDVISIDLSLYLSRSFLYSLSYEGNFEKTISYGRIFMNITQRF